MCVSLRVFKGLRVVLRCVCVVCLVGMFGFVSCVLVFGDANVQQQTSPFFSRCHAPSSQPWVPYDRLLPVAITYLVFCSSCPFSSWACEILSLDEICIRSLWSFLSAGLRFACSVGAVFLILWMAMGSTSSLWKRITVTSFDCHEGVFARSLFH